MSDATSAPGHGFFRRNMVALIRCLLLLVLVSGCVSTSVAPPAALADLAPSGRLRAGINFGNPVLVQKNPVTGAPTGLAVDLAQELGRRLGVPVELVTFDAAGKMADAVKRGEWDIAFLAVDPVRAADISFSAPYLEIEGVYLVPAGSSLRTSEDVDRDGGRVAVGRILPGRFMAIGQAAGVPHGRDAGAAYVRAFIEDAKASGFVARSLARHGIEGASIAPLAPLR